MQLVFEDQNFALDYDFVPKLFLIKSYLRCGKVKEINDMYLNSNFKEYNQRLLYNVKRFFRNNMVSKVWNKKKPDKSQL